MIFRQMFDSVSFTYTYLLASREGSEALIIDPVLDKVDRYIQLIAELNLKLVKAIDTHVHADHITGLGALRDRTKCITVAGKESGTDVVSMRVSDGDRTDSSDRVDDWDSGRGFDREGSGNFRPPAALASTATAPDLESLQRRSTKLSADQSRPNRCGQES